MSYQQSKANGKAMYKKVIIALLVLCQTLVGCATTITHQEHIAKSPTTIKLYNECRSYDEFGVKQQIYYSGTRFLLAWMNLPFACHGEECMGRLTYPVILPFYLIDLPFSFIADTILAFKTYNIQYNECPKYDFDKLQNERNEKCNLLHKRIGNYYDNYHDAEKLWLMYSIDYKSKISENEFINSYRNLPNNSNDKFVIMISVEREDVAKFTMTNGKNPPTYYIDKWIYENNNWFIAAHTLQSSDSDVIAPLLEK